MDFVLPSPILADEEGFVHTIRACYNVQYQYNPDDVFPHTLCIVVAAASDSTIALSVFQIVITYIFLNPYKPTSAMILYLISILRFPAGKIKRSGRGLKSENYNSGICSLIK